MKKTKRRKPAPTKKSKKKSAAKKAKPARKPQGPPPSVLLHEVVDGLPRATTLHTITRLRVAEHLKAGPRPVSELAAKTGANEDALYRLLRALATLGIFAETKPRTFKLTPAADLLRPDAKGSMYDFLMFFADPFYLKVFGELMHSVRTGGTAVEKATGKAAFEYFEHDKAESEIFNNCMTAISRENAPLVLMAYDFSGIGTLVDVAGGHGFLLGSILAKYPKMRGVLFDLPHVVGGARSKLAAMGVVDRVQTMSGDFFQSVPAGDAYIMKNIIHDWDDEKSIAILRSCARAMTSNNGKVLLVEMVIPPGNTPHPGKWLDLAMLVMPGGKERTKAEYAALFQRAGLKLKRVVPTLGPYSVVEAVKA